MVMRYLITFSYHNKSDGQLRYFSKLTEDGTTPDQIIAATFENQANHEFGPVDVQMRNYRERMAVVSVVEIRKDYADKVASYLSNL